MDRRESYTDNWETRGTRQRTGHTASGSKGTSRARRTGELDALKTSKDLTYSMEQAVRMMQDELDRSAQLSVALKQSTQTLAKTNDEYTQYTTLLRISRGLTGNLFRKEQMDKILISVGLIFFFSVVAFIIYKRIAWLIPNIGLFAALGRILKTMPRLVYNLCINASRDAPANAAKHVTTGGVKQATLLSTSTSSTTVTTTSTSLSTTTAVGISSIIASSDPVSAAIVSTALAAVTSAVSSILESSIVSSTVETASVIPSAESLQEVQQPHSEPTEVVEQKKTEELVRKVSEIKRKRPVKIIDSDPLNLGGEGERPHRSHHHHDEF